MKTPRSPRRSAALGLSCLAAAALLAACGGGADGQPAIEAQAAELSSDVAIDAPTVAPSFHLAHVLPPEPSDIDADGSGASALQAPARVALSDDLAGLSTAGAARCR